MPYVSAAQVHASLSHLLKITESDMPSYWRPIAVDAANFARQEIKGRLLKRGFLDTGAYDLDDWSRATEFSRDLACWKAIHLGGVYNNFDPVALKAMDRRDELDTVLVDINGVWIKPTGDGASLSQTGPRTDTGESVFGVFPDPDGLTGDPHKW